MNPLENNLISKDKIKDVLITKTATKTQVSPAEIEKLINFVFKDAAAAFHKGTSVEISGFGVFKFSLKKLHKDLKTKESKLSALKKNYEKTGNVTAKKFIDLLEIQIAEIKTKINELEKN